MAALVMLVVMGLVVGPTSPAGAVAPGTVVSRAGRLITHVPGPAGADRPSRLVTEAQVEHDLASGSVHASAYLAGEVDATSAIDVVAQLGTPDTAGRCVPADGGSFRGSVRAGEDSIDIIGGTPQSRSATWTCATVLAVAAGQPVGSAFSGVTGGLHDVAAEVTLSPQVEGPLLLRRHRWTRVPVTVSNIGTATSPAVTISSRSKDPVTGVTTGVRVRTRSIGPLGRRQSKTVKVWMRLDGRTSGTLLLRVTGGGSQAGQAVQAFPLKPPRPGRWSGTTAAGRVSFRVAKGARRIVGWKGVVSGTCGGVPTTRTYSFPTTRINQHGVARREVKLRHGGSIVLRASVTGGRVVSGSFLFDGPGPGLCLASSPWTAKRR